MTVLVKSLADGQLAATTGDLYTAPTAVQTVVESIKLTNTDTSARTVNIYFLASGGTARTISSVDLSLAAGYTVEVLDKPITLSAGDKIQGVASVAVKVDYVISGVDTTGGGDAATSFTAHDDTPAAHVAEMFLTGNAAGTACEYSALADTAYFLDEDDMASDSATKVASQQSIKAYADLHVLHSLATAASDFLVASGAGVFVKQTLAQVKTLVVTAVQLGTVIHGVANKATPVDADKVPLIDTEASNVLKTSTWTQVKAFLKTYFDTLYNKYVHPNHSGDVTSVADGAQTIVNKVTMTATAPVTVSGTPTVIAGGAVAIALPAATNAAAGHATAAHITAIEANTAKVTNATHSGDATGATALTIANDAVTYAKMQDVSDTDKVLGRSTAGAGNVEEIACTAAGRALLDDATAGAQRTTLGLPSALEIGGADELDIRKLIVLKSAPFYTINPENFKDTNAWTDAPGASGTLSVNSWNATLATGTTNASKASVYGGCFWLDRNYGFTRMMMGGRVSPRQVTNNVFYWGLFETPAGPSDADNQIAFKLAGTTLTAQVYNGTLTQTDTGVDPGATTYVDWGIVINSGSVDFYADDTGGGIPSTPTVTITTNIPDDLCLYLLFYAINSEAANKELYVYAHTVITTT